MKESAVLREEISDGRMVCSEAATKAKTEQKAQQMKILNKKNLLGRAIAIAIALGAWLPTHATAAEETMKPMKGSEHLLMLNKIETKAEADALKPDATIAMVCAKCKTVYVTRVKQGVKGAQLLMEKGQPKELIGTHACAGCNSTITVVGHAKGDVTELKHSCKACGDDSAFCCATKSVGDATKGMEKK
jgi:hypothetical protein